MITNDTELNEAVERLAKLKENAEKTKKIPVKSLPPAYRISYDEQVRKIEQEITEYLKKA